MTRPLDVLFREVLIRYPIARREEKFGLESAFWPLVHEVKSALATISVLAGSKRTRLKVSFGQGGWAEVPNFAIMDSRETERPSAGLYIVYLVRADASGIVLSLNQGSADLFFTLRSGAYSVLKARSAKVREVLPLTLLREAGFDTDPIDLASNAQYPRAYAAGNVIAKTYLAESIPDGERLNSDLATLHAAYQALIPSSRMKLAEVRGSPWRTPV